LSCGTFAANAVRLQLHPLAYNLDDFMPTLAIPTAAEPWSLTTPREKLIKIGAKVLVSHAARKRHTTMGGVRFDSGKTRRFRGLGAVNWRFRPPSVAPARDLPLPGRPKARSWSNNHPESGECRIKTTGNPTRIRDRPMHSDVASAVSPGFEGAEEDHQGRLAHSPVAKQPRQQLEYRNGRYDSQPSGERKINTNASTDQTDAENRQQYADRGEPEDSRQPARPGQQHAAPLSKRSAKGAIGRARRKPLGSLSNMRRSGH
jgi:hypothetical protein